MAQPDLMAAERQSAILERIRKDRRVVASELAAAFDTSEDTIRRALRDLAAKGHCKRVYGGALAIARRLARSLHAVPRPLIAKLRLERPWRR